MKNVYLERYAVYPHALITSPPARDLGLIVTVPCYDEPALLASLEALYACHQPSCSVEVIILINESESCSGEVSLANAKSFREAVTWVSLHDRPSLRFYPIYLDKLPQKHAGVGLARKIAMDEAVRRFRDTSVGEDGIISCFDADCLCEENYLTEIVSSFRERPGATACSVYFEHPLEGSLSPDLYRAITDYELFLRYYDHALKWAGFPYAHQTIGSSMAVRSGTYQRQGGMNRRKAGEDFYFLHKIIPLGGFFDLKTTKVIPSPRISKRVPFGTGKAVGDWVERRGLLTYHPQIFQDLKVMLEKLGGIYFFEEADLYKWMGELPAPVRDFLENQSFPNYWGAMRKNSACKTAFDKHFYHWFNGFKVLKYVHFARDAFYPNIPIEQAASHLMRATQGTDRIPEKAKDLLLRYREIDLHDGSG